MELTTLRYFVTVARELHFRHAAEKLHMTQAPLSAAIRKLEEELEVRLFDRTSRSVKLTEAGTFFLPEAEAVLLRAELAQKRLAEKVSQHLAQLTLGYNETALNEFLPRILARCRRKLPALRLELRELETGEQLEWLHQGKLDIGLMRPFGFDLHGLESRLVSRESYCLVMPEDHPLGRFPALDTADLAGREIILFAREVNPAIYDELTARLTADAARPPIFRQNARNKHSVLAMVKAGFGAALLPESCCRLPLPGIAVRQLNIDLPPVDILAVWDPERQTAALDKFIALLPAETAAK